MDLHAYEPTNITGGALTRLPHEALLPNPPNPQAPQAPQAPQGGPGGQPVGFRFYMAMGECDILHI